jgi:hypothetical protein
MTKEKKTASLNKNYKLILFQKMLDMISLKLTVCIKIKKLVVEIQKRVGSCPFLPIPLSKLLAENQNINVPERKAKRFHRQKILVVKKAFFWPAV